MRRRKGRRQIQSQEASDEAWSLPNLVRGFQKQLSKAWCLLCRDCEWSRLVDGRPAGFRVGGSPKRVNPASSSDQGELGRLAVLPELLNNCVKTVSLYSLPLSLPLINLFPKKREHSINDTEIIAPTHSTHLGKGKTILLPRKGNVL